MVRLLLQFRSHTQIVSYALRIATFATDTIDMYVQAIESMEAADPKLDEKIARSPLMVDEIRKQESDLSRLAKVKTQHDLRDFRIYATCPERSNIGLSVQR